MTRLMDIARVIRSKNAGPFEVTLDVILPDRATYERVLESGSLTKERIAQAYGVSVTDVVVLQTFPAGCAIKATLRRRVTSGSFGDTDVLGAQQHVPMMLIELPARKDG